MYNFLNLPQSITVASFTVDLTTFKEDYDSKLNKNR